jgi:hypothetical protein
MKKKFKYTIVAYANQEATAITEHMTAVSWRHAVRSFILDREGQDLTIVEVLEGHHIGLLPEPIYTQNIKE